jgi:hypothetical protein
VHDAHKSSGRLNVNLARLVDRQLRFAITLCAFGELEGSGDHVLRDVAATTEVATSDGVWYEIETDILPRKHQLAYPEQGTSPVNQNAELAEIGFAVWHRRGACSA